MHEGQVCAELSKAHTNCPATELKTVNNVNMLNCVTWDHLHREKNNHYCL